MTVETTPAGAPPADSAPASTPATVPPPPTTEQTPAPSAAEPAEQAQTEPGEPAAEQNAEQGEKDEQKPKKRWSERVDQLTAQKHALTAERDALRSELERLRQPIQAPTDRELTFEEQENLRLRQVVREERADQLESEVRRRQTEELSLRQKTFEARVADVAERMPDFHEKFHQDLPVSDFAADFLADSERGAEIAYYLGSNPKEAAEIHRLPVAQQAIRLARLEARLSSAPQVRKTSAAPNPPPTVGGGVSPGPKDPSTMSMSEYAEWYRKRSKGA